MTNFLIPKRVLIFLSFLFSGFSLHAQSVFQEHKSVVILPAFFYYELDTANLNPSFYHLKIDSQYRREIGRDVQYKFYIPFLMHQKDYTAFFHGVDTVNVILDRLGFNVTNEGQVDFIQLGNQVETDAFITLVLKENTTLSSNSANKILLNYFSPLPGMIGKALSTQNIIDELNKGTGTVSLTLTAKIIDSKTGKTLWEKTESVSDQFYHDALRIMVNRILTKMPYRIKKGTK